MKAKQFLAALATTAALAGAAQAAPVLDASYQPGSLIGYANNSELYRAQVFTVERTGKLVRFEAALVGTGSSEFQIWNVTAGVPAVIPGTSLASATVNFSGTGFFGADITSFDLDVTAGDVLALVQIGGTWSAGNSWLFSTGGTYTGGGAYTTFVGAASGSWHVLVDNANADFGFTTFVDDGSRQLPEPLSASLVLAGLAGAAFARRRVQGLSLR